jgi:hypothetical protein
VVPKHLRSEEPSPVPVGTPANGAPADGAPASGGPANGAPANTAEFGLEELWGPPPAMYPDHPSAPVPRLQLPDGHPSGPMPIQRPPAPTLPVRAANRPYPPGPGPRSTGRHAAAPGAHPNGDVSRFQRQPGTIRHDASAHLRSNGPGFREPLYHRRDAGRDTPRGRHASGRFQDGQYPDGQYPDGEHPDENSIRRGEQILAAAEREAAAITERATAEASAIREAAEREAAELRARLDSMFGELGKVVTDYLSEMLAAPGTRAPDTAMPPATAEMPTIAAEMPTIAAEMPTTVAEAAAAAPVHPGAKPAVRGTSSARPASKRVGRQAKAMKKMTAAFVVASMIGAVAGTSELMLHGYPFFIFRANGAGATETGPKEPANPPRAGHTFLPGAHHRPTTAEHQASNGRK